MMMQQVVTIGDMRRLEQEAVKCGIPYDTLMERAGAAAVEVLCTRFANDLRHVLVLCGNGNNGGDGFVIARRLCASTACAVTVLLVSGTPATSLASKKFEQLSNTRTAVLTLPDDPAAADDVWRTIGLFSVSHVVDAVYGIGFHGSLPLYQKRAFQTIAALSCPVLAVDIPSGMNADSGLFDSCTLNADITVTFTANKPAVLLPTAAPLFGEVMVADVGIDPILRDGFTTRFSVINDEIVRGMMLPRPADSHKGTFGRLLSVCGSYGMAGALLLSGKAALRSGVGLLHIALPRSIYPIVAGQLWEAVYHPLCETEDGRISQRAVPELMDLTAGKDAVLIGCGLSQHPETQALLTALLSTLSVPVVVDADGLNMLCEHILMLKAINAPLILTPHSAEMARLLDKTVTDVECDRPAAAKLLAEETGAVVVLKGHRTLVASPEGDVYINTTGNSGMATGGSGDVLSGMIAALAAGGMPPLHAALSGVYLHGLAGDASAARLSETATLPTDMLEDLARLLSHFEKRE